MPFYIRRTPTLGPWVVRGEIVEGRLIIRYPARWSAMRPPASDWVEVSGPARAVSDDEHALLLRGAEEAEAEAVKILSQVAMRIGERMMRALPARFPDLPEE